MNKLIKSNIIRSFFLIEIITILLLYLFGAQGLPALLRLKNENILIEKEIDQLRNKVGKLEKNIKEWQEYDFYKEKIAREQLQMAREGDYIYYLSNQKDEET